MAIKVVYYVTYHLVLDVKSKYTLLIGRI